MKVFVSYDYDRHRNYKSILAAWVIFDKEIKYLFNDISTDTSIKSKDTNYIKRQIKSKISESDYFMVIVGDYASNNTWVNWECGVAVSLFKKISVIKINEELKIPDCLRNYAYKKVFDGFNKENITSALSW